MGSIKRSWLHFSIEVNWLNSLIVKFFWSTLLASGFLIRILLFDNLHNGPPSQEHSHTSYPPQNYICMHKNDKIWWNSIKNQRNFWQTKFWQHWVCQTTNFTFSQVLWTPFLWKEGGTQIKSIRCHLHRQFKIAPSSSLTGGWVSPVFKIMIIWVECKSNF